MTCFHFSISPSFLAERLDVMGMLTDAFNMGKFGIDMVGKIFNCRGEITALVTDSKIDDILHDLQQLNS